MAMPTQPTLPTTRQTADERRAEIVRAALTEFAAGGYSGTSTDAIARRVGVSQPYLFQLFGTKRELFLATVRHGFERTRLVFEDAARRGRAEEGPACDVLHTMGKAYMDLLSDRDLLRVQLQAYAACGDDDVRTAVREEFGRLYALVRDESGASPEALHLFFAEGMLLNVAASLELGGSPKTWSLGRLLDEANSNGGRA
jgi:AcrR family transcriptional regulator